MVRIGRSEQADTLASAVGTHFASEQNRGEGANLAVPTNGLNPAARFYRDGLGYPLAGGFGGRGGFDGIMLGHGAAGHRLGFAKEHGHGAERARGEHDPLVFYTPHREGWGRAVRRVGANASHPVRPFDPRRAEAGKAFDDPDGCRVVPRNAAWPA